MITKDAAEQLVIRYLETLKPHVESGVSLVPQETIERPYGWVFFYNSNRYLETGDVFEALGGNSPILIDARSGELIFLGTARPVAESLARFELEHGLTAELT